MDAVTDSGPGLSISSRSERGCVIAALSGELDITCAPALREQLLGLLRPGASRLVIDLSRVSYADASGLAVLAGTGRRAGLLGGFLRLAAPTPAVAWVLRVTGLHRQLDVFPTVQAAITSRGRGQHRTDGSLPSSACRRTGPQARWHELFGRPVAGPVPGPASSGRLNLEAGQPRLTMSVAAPGWLVWFAWRNRSCCRVRARGRARSRCRTVITV